MLAQGEELYRHREKLAPRDFLRLFRSGAHSSHDTPDALPEWLARGARLVMEERPPWEAEVPLAALADAGFPKLVISGAHSPAFEAVCDALADGIGARRAVIAGRGHTIPSAGAAYNACLHDFLTACERQRLSPR